MSRNSTIEIEHAPPRRVDFHGNASDFQCVLLAALGWTTFAIANETGLTKSQVEYRLRMAEEKERAAGKKSARFQYRNGQSPVAKLAVAQLLGGRSKVKKAIVTSLDKKGLYAPRPQGVMRDSR